MIVTRIERQKRSPHRVNVYIDGEFGFGIEDAVLAKFGLRKGDALTTEQLDSLTSSEEEERAKRQALHYISYRMRSESELRKKLVQKEYPPVVVEKTIARLRDLGFTNDLEFARLFVRAQQLRRPSGKRLLLNKLRLKGISGDIIEQVLSGSADDNKERSAALEAARKHLKRRTIPRDPAGRMKEKQRVARFLAGRGFEWSTISPVLRLLFVTDPKSEEEF